MTEINYMTQGKVEMPKLNEPAILDWIVAVALSHHQKVGCLTYVFCDDDYILETNRQFLGHDYYTDIITFDYTNSRHIAGDMVISLDTVRSNAEMLGVSYKQELLRVIIHGVLNAKSWRGMKTRPSRCSLTMSFWRTKPVDLKR